ncbi:MAG: hypothetical protein RSE54_11620, partial [Ruthenibacterium sp.]
MTVTDLMKGVTPTTTFEGIATADDFVLAIDFTGTATGPAQFIVAQEGITETSGALESITQDAQYIRSGKQTIKTGTQR